jgi:hypothetical protein
MVLLFNIGVPMIMPTMYFMVVALIPIVLLESWYVSRTLLTRFSGTAGPIAFANIFSTVVGVPLTWLLLFGIQMMTGEASYGIQGFAGKILAVTVQAPWVQPFGAGELWMFHLAALFLLIPFFFATWFIEYAVARNKLARLLIEAGRTVDKSVAFGIVFTVIRKANLLSYGLIALLLVASLIFSALRP